MILNSTPTFLREANAAAIGDTIALPAITLSRRGRVRPLVII